MKIKWKLIVTTVGLAALVGTVATSIASCGSNNPIPTPTPTPPPSPTDYIGKWDGSDWKGHENLPGHLELGINEDGTTACIERVNGDVEFAAYNFVIPDSVYGEDGTTVYKLTKINNDAFSTAADYACLFGTLTIGNNIEEIGDSAFYQCYALTGDLIFPNSVISIGNSAFYQCSNFYGRLRFGDHVEHIGSEAFVDDNFTENLIIKNSVESVGQYAFFHTNNFAKLVFEGWNQQPNWDSEATEIFGDWDDSGIVSSTGSWGSSDALSFAISHGLPSGWHV